MNKERKVAILIVMMTASFYLTWTPYAVTSLLAMVSSRTSNIQTIVSSPRISIIISILFAKVGTILNPLLYIFFNKDVSIAIVEKGNNILMTEALWLSNSFKITLI